MVTAEHKIFLSTPSARRATCRQHDSQIPRQNFYPRPPRGGRPPSVPHFGIEWYISIHALREEGDSAVSGVWTTVSEFLSTPSARRATRLRGHGRNRRDISIHALREEGDGSIRGRQRVHLPFLSTPSARRATTPGIDTSGSSEISIHALREEGDSSRTPNSRQMENFYPRPPRGGRRPSSHTATQRRYFYPRPPRGGRR